MWRMFTLAGLLTLLAWPAHAAAISGWEICRGPGPAVTDCAPLTGSIDPQGREIWLRGSVTPRRPGQIAPTLHIAGATSSEVWFNGVRIGANGQPGPTATAERPGRYQAAFPLRESLWRADGNQLVLRLSAFHGGLRFDHPVGGVWIDRVDHTANRRVLAVTFLAAGALLAAAFGFAAVHIIRRTASSLTLAAMAGVAALQAGLESLRHLVNYEYPLHAWRVGAIWLTTAMFALLLVAYVAARFAPNRQRQLSLAAAGGVMASLLAPGFDQKSAIALLVGVGFAAVAAGLGLRRRLAGAGLHLAYLAAFAAVAVALPFLLLDLSFFIMAVGLTLPLLVLEVLRLGRDDRDREAALTLAASRPDRLTVASARGVELVPMPDIVAIVGADDYAELRLTGGRSLLHAARLDRLEAQLPTGFIRIHRSVIANLAHVVRLERGDGRARLLMSQGGPLPVSRARLPAVREALDEIAIPRRVA